MNTKTKLLLALVCGPILLFIAFLNIGKSAESFIQRAEAMNIVKEQSGSIPLSMVQESNGIAFRDITATLAIALLGITSLIFSILQYRTLKKEKLGKSIREEPLEGQTQPSQNKTLRANG